MCAGSLSLCCETLPGFTKVLVAVKVITKDFSKRKACKTLSNLEGKSSYISEGKKLSLRKKKCSNLILKKRSMRTEKIKKTTLVTSKNKATEPSPYRKWAKL